MNPKAVERLFAVKKRPPNQPVSALFSSLKEAQKFLVLSPKALALAKKYLPGPLTIVAPLHPHSPFALYVVPTLEPLAISHPPSSSDYGRAGKPSATVGLRLSSQPTAQALVTAFGGPIATTSANTHGEENPYSVQDILSQFKDVSLQPDLILDDGVLPKTPPSTVIEVIGNNVRVLRQGDVAVRGFTA